MKFAVIKSGGKQYIVHEKDEIVIDQLKADKDAAVEFEVLATGDKETASIELGTPVLTKKAKGKLFENLRGDKIRVARFRAKSRYRKVTGFRAELSRVKITSF